MWLSSALIDFILMSREGLRTRSVVFPKRIAICTPDPDRIDNRNLGVLYDPCKPPVGIDSALLQPECLVCDERLPPRSNAVSGGRPGTQGDGSSDPGQEQIGMSGVAGTS